jgi:lysozyme
MQWILQWLSKMFSRNIMRTVPQQALTLIKQFEGLRLTAYPDPGTGAEPWTIGYGHTGNVTKGMVITEIQANAFLMEDARNACNQVLEVVTVTLNDNELSALVDFVYNLGIGNLHSSTLLKKLNTSDFAGAADQFLVWDMAAGHVMPGLLRRRTAERSVFLTSL